MWEPSSMCPSSLLYLTTPTAQIVEKSSLKKSGKNCVINATIVCHFHCRQTLRASACSILAHIKHKSMDYSVLGIDEGQFVSVTLCWPIFYVHQPFYNFRSPKGDFEKVKFEALTPKTEMGALNSKHSLLQRPWRKIRDYKQFISITRTNNHLKFPAFSPWLIWPE